MSRPNASAQMATACMLLSPTLGKKINGVQTYEWPEAGPIIFANLKSYGGSERVANDLLVIEDTLVLTAWYRPDIRANCRVKIMQSGAVYEIINEPENWEMRNQFLVCKLRRVKGNG